MFNATYTYDLNQSAQTIVVGMTKKSVMKLTLLTGLISVAPIVVMALVDQVENRTRKTPVDIKPDILNYDN